MKRLSMKIEISRFKNSRLKLIVQHEETSYFWKSSLTECPRIEDEKLRTESLMMVEWWNKEHHEEFELLWNSWLKDKINKVGEV